jgi:hypothetical protein
VSRRSTRIEFYLATEFNGHLSGNQSTYRALKIQETERQERITMQREARLTYCPAVLSIYSVPNIFPNPRMPQRWTEVEPDRKTGKVPHVRIAKQ